MCNLNLQFNMRLRIKRKEDKKEISFFLHKKEDILSGLKLFLFFCEQRVKMKLDRQTDLTYCK